jgi:hypothetical protein
VVSCQQYVYLCMRCQYGYGQLPVNVARSILGATLDYTLCRLGSVVCLNMALLPGCSMFLKKVPCAQSGHACMTMGIV